MRYALIVGIDKYKNKGNNLRGCVNDAMDVFKSLRIRGLNYSNITMLLNETATKENITFNLKRLVDGLKKGDSLTYYHSGHGTQILDKNNDEVDGLDEALVTYDFDRNDAFTDDVLRECLLNHPIGARINLIFDTCHSGGFEMNSSEQSSRSIISDDLNKIPKYKLKKLGVRQTDTHKQRHILLAGCEEQKYSYEAKVNNKVRGLMTHSLCSLLRKNRNLDWNSFFLKLYEAVSTKTKNRQQPQIIIPSGLLYESDGNSKIKFWQKVFR